MRVHLRNKDFWIYWNYQHFPKTYCYIKSEEQTEAIGEATKDPRDKHVKETARKISLASALKRAGFSKEEREMVWLQYFSRNDEQMERQLAELLKQIA